MGGDTFRRRPLYLSGCISPSCAPVHEEYSRIPQAKHDETRRSRRLRKLLRRIVDEGKCIYAPTKPSAFHYDAVSYLKNFDDGCHRYGGDCPRAASVTGSSFQVATNR